MVLSDSSALLDFLRFGIKIPALDSRKTRTLDSLTTHPELAERKSEWYREGIDILLSREDLSLAHSRDYIDGFFNEKVNHQLITAYELVNKDGSYNRWVPEDAEKPLRYMMPQLLKMISGAYNAGRIALESGFCHFLGGGTHHGHWDFGHGFCPLNDSALAVSKLISEKKIQRAWIIDLDAHKGDGTAAIFKDDSRVTTFSIHMTRGWPIDGSLPKNHPSYIPGDIDIPIESGDENSYLDRLEAALKRLKEDYTADFAVVLAGSDPWEKDELPSTSLLNLSREQLLERDQLVYSFLESNGLPSAWLMAGGYGKDSWEIHSGFLTWALLKLYAMRAPLRKTI